LHSSLKRWIEEGFVAKKKKKKNDPSAEFPGELCNTRDRLSRFGKNIVETGTIDNKRRCGRESSCIFRANNFRDAPEMSAHKK
jgi:hypothetical protein